MDTRVQIVAVLASGALLIGVLELVRRRRMLERYALLWLFSAVILLGLAVWRGALNVIAHAIGVIYPPNAIFVVAFGFVLFLLLHFSLAVSRLTDQTKVLAQRLALLEAREREHRRLLGEDFDEEAEEELVQARRGSPRESLFGRR